ncbi:MAG: helix-turn-helix domain-containing protein [Bacillota bacterium]
MKSPWIDDFLKKQDVIPVAKTIYLTACLEPLSITELCRISSMSRGRVRYHLQALARQGWIVLRKEGRRVLVLPTAPDVVQVKHAKILKAMVSMALFRGEAQMKVLLDVLVVSRYFVENARPDFLRSPVTGLNLEVDRLYPDVAGFEYEGAQHSRPAVKFGGKPKYDNTRVNDLIKAGMTVEANIQLVRVVKADLTVEGMQRLIPASMKTWPLVEGPYLQAIRETCAEYMQMDTGEEDQRESQ